MGIAVCAIGLAVCVVCIFGMGMIGKLRSRVHRRFEGPSS